MRLQRLGFILLAFYLVFLGGSSYYNMIFPLRVFHHAVITLLLVLWLVRRIRRGWGLPATALNPGLYALIIIWFVAAAFSLDPRMSFEQVWFLVTHVMVFWVLVDLFQRGRQRLVLEAQFILAALVVLLGFLQLFSWYFGLGITPDSRIGWFSVIGPGAWLPLRFEPLWLPLGVTTWLAAYTAPLVVVTAAWGATTPRHDFRRVLWGLCGALLLTMFLSFSRGGIIALGAATGAFLLMRSISRLRTLSWFSPQFLLRFALLGAIIAGGILAVFTISGSPSRMSGDALRRDLWNSAVEIIVDHPVLGVGPGMFGRALRTYRDPAVADDRIATSHNLYLNTTAEIGLIGLVVCVILAVLMLRDWRSHWQETATENGRLRLEAVYAALVGVGAQSVFDTFTSTAVVSVFLVLLAYAAARQGGRLHKPPVAGRWTALSALVIVLGYGVFFIPVDIAHGWYLRSFQPGERAVEYVRAASEVDPGLHLYALQQAYLSSDENALAAYRRAVELEPTWDTGWLNLAALAERQGDLRGAMQYLEQARQISHHNPAGLHWARLAEQTASAPESTIAQAYVTALRSNRYNQNPPFSDFWSGTPLRIRALEQYSQDLPLDFRYRLFAAHPILGDATTLVPELARTAAEWWVVGQDSLMRGQTEAAVEAFSRAIQIDRANGDYYVSRARAEWMENPAAAERDLNLGELLGTRFEYPNAARVNLVKTPDDIYRLRVTALPPRVLNQNFEGVLFTRAAGFEIFTEMRYPGPGTEAMQPWYDIAADYEANGQLDRAINVYRAILDYAPDEARARDELARLGN